MSFFGETNRDSYSVAPSAAATGPLVGFFESWSVAVDAQMRASSQFGIEYFMQELDWNQTRAMLDAGVEDPPQLILGLEGRRPGEGAVSVAQMMRSDSGYYEDFIPERSGAYLDVARRYAGEEISPEFEERLQAYDARVLQIRQDRPDLELMTSREMFDRVREDAQAAESRLDGDRRTWGGAFGGFFGGALSSMHPGTDPLNFYSLGIGGAGKTALQRILFQTGAQGVVETINQVTGVQEERQLLGLSHGFADAAQRVAATALGAGALQGVGEVVGAGVRQWLRDVPTDRAPDITVAEPQREPLALPSPEQFREEAQTIRLERDGRAYTDILAEQAPLSGIRTAEPRIVADIGDMTRQLEAWDGGAPASLGARTANIALPGETRAARIGGVQAALDNNRLYQLAKEADPQAFRQYEQLIERRNTYRRWVEELAQGRDRDVQQTMDRIEARLHALEARHKTTQGKTNKLRIRQEMTEVRADREALIAASRTRETRDIAQVRQELVKVDEKMRDIAPLIGRAYSRARGRWGETAQELDAVWASYRSGRAQPDMPSDAVLPDYDTAMMSLSDRAPILRQSNRVEPGATSADTARAIVAENAKVIDEALTAYRAEVRRLVDVSEDGKLRIEGRGYEFDLDKDTMFVPHEEGTGGREVTLREFLEETRRADDELEAVSTCSIR